MGWWLEPPDLTVQHPAVLYLHGVKGTRGRSYRLGLARLLLSLGLPVLCIDYRGFADSGPVGQAGPGEAALVADGLAALDWLRARWPGRVLVWGHSLGSAVATHTVAEDHGNPQVAGLVIESPFNNLAEQDWN